MQTTAILQRILLLNHLNSAMINSKQVAGVGTVNNQTTASIEMVPAQCCF